MGVIVPSSGTSPLFYNTEEVLNIARVLVNDAQSGLAGQNLADSRPETWVILNLAYAKLQNWLEDTNVESATYAESTITIPASSGSPDPSAQCRLGYDGFVDSMGFYYPQPTLPAYMLEPLNIGWRVTGQNVPFMDIPQKLGGLGSAYGGLIARWEYRQNSVYFTGGVPTQADLLFRYIPALPELVKPTGDVASPTIYFARAGEALAYMVAAEYQEIHNAPNAPITRGKANEQLQIIANKAAKRENQTQTRRRGYGFGGRRVGSAYRIYG